MRRVTALICVGVCALALAEHAVAQTEQDAVAVVERFQRALIDAAHADEPLDLDGRIALLAPVVADTHDLERMGHITVRRAIRDWSEEQRAGFHAAFERLSVVTYAGRFAAIGRDALEITGSRLERDTRAVVEALIRRADPGLDPVPLTYTLSRAGDNWQITNVTAEGYSDLAGMISDFTTILSSGGYQDLIAEIQARIDAEIESFGSGQDR
jgi:phospholipid transport system substrate-binding protein